MQILFTGFLGTLFHNFSLALKLIKFISALSSREEENTLPWLNSLQVGEPTVSPSETTTSHGLYSNSPPMFLDHMTFFVHCSAEVTSFNFARFLHEDSQYEDCWASQACHQLHQFYLLVNLQRVNSSGETLNNIFTYTDKINYHRAILFLNIDFKKGMHEFLDKQTRTSIMQFTVTLSEVQWKKWEFLKVVTCWLRPTVHHSICAKHRPTYLKSLLFSLWTQSSGQWPKLCMRSWAGLP